MNSNLGVLFTIFVLSTCASVDCNFTFEQKLTLCRYVCIFRSMERLCYKIPEKNLTVSACVYGCLQLQGGKSYLFFISKFRKLYPKKGN